MEDDHYPALGFDEVFRVLSKKNLRGLEMNLVSKSEKRIYVELQSFMKKDILFYIGDKVVRYKFGSPGSIINRSIKCVSEDCYL